MPKKKGNIEVEHILGHSNFNVFVMFILHNNKLFVYNTFRHVIVCLVII